MLFEITKRILDILVSIALSIVFLPVVIISIIAQQIESPGPVFADTPKRVGIKGKLFRIYKLRSMIPNAHYLLHTDPKFRQLLKEYKKSSYKLHEDPRVTKVGKFIRKYSIDEIPQVINVFRREMSVVGPRPYYSFEIREQQERYPEAKDSVREVLRVRPGITGPWQVTGRSDVNFDERIKIDAEYARRRSILYDMMILLKTPWAMLSGRGAV
jgi:lipopolysaccharide/colanic/teichoic acid biosynthesis glycosyltransferase